MSSNEEGYKDAFRKPHELLALVGLTPVVPTSANNTKKDKKDEDNDNDDKATINDEESNTTSTATSTATATTVSTNNDTKKRHVLEISAGFGYLAKHIATMDESNVMVDAQNGTEFRELFESFGIQKVIDMMEKDYPNIKHRWSSFNDPAWSQEDVYDVVTCQNSFHDLYGMKSVHRTKFFQSIYKSLRPSNGRLLMVDHKAAVGRGSKDAESLHRIEEAMVRQELQDCGFEIILSSDIFAYPDDDYTVTAWKEPNIRTDRFVLVCKAITNIEQKEDDAATAAKQVTISNQPDTKETDEPPSKKAKSM